MLPDLSQRSGADELMDDFTLGGDLLAEALHELRIINLVLGTAWTGLEGVWRLWHRAGKPRRLTILDIGAGSGDLNRLLLRWADWQGISMQIVLIDMHPETCAVAAAHYRNEPRVQVECGDLFQLAPCRADIVTATQFVHHFSNAQLPTVFEALLRTARVGVVVNDLHRHVFAWLAIWTATHLLSRNRMIRHDAPLSVQRGFRAAELARLRAIPALRQLRYTWRPFFRYLVIVPARHGASHTKSIGDRLWLT